MRKPVKTIDQIEKEETEVEKEDGRGKTPRELVVERAPNGLYFIAWTGGGEVHDSLKGRYTSSVRAQADIANFKAMQAQQKQ